MGVPFFAAPRLFLSGISHILRESIVTNSGMDYWNGILDWTTGMAQINS